MLTRRRSLTISTATKRLISRCGPVKHRNHSLNSPQFVFADYARALERIFDDDAEAHERANQLLAEAERFFAPIEASLPPTERRHNAYFWHRLQDDQVTHADENAYVKLERICYCGYETSVRERFHWQSAAKAAKRQEQGGEEVSRDAQKSTLKRTLQPCARDLYFIEHPPGTIGESRVYESVSKRKAKFGERCILTALRELPKSPHIISTRPHCRQRVASLQRSPRLWLQFARGTRMDERRRGACRRTSSLSRCL